MTNPEIIPPPQWTAIIGLLLAIEATRPYIDYGSGFAGQYAKRELDTAVKLARMAVADGMP